MIRSLLWSTGSSDFLPRPPLGESKEGTLTRLLPTLQRVVDSASNCIESRETPLAPNVTTLFGSGQEENRQELYLTFDHGRIYVLVAQAKDPNQEAAAIKQLRKWIARTRSEVPGVNVEITGEAVLRHDEMEQARLDTETAALISLVLTALIFIVSCREILRPLMATFCLLIGICYTLGFATLTVGRLNILSITLVPILIGLAIDYGVHLIFRYEEEVRQGQSPRLAIGKALGFTGIGVITNALTIAGAFYFMMLTDFKGMQEMGLIAGTGVIVCLVPMLTLLPLLLVRGNPDLPDQQATQSKLSRRDTMLISLPFRRAHQRAAPRKHSRRARIEQLYLKRPWLVLGCGAVFTMFMILQSFKVQFDYNLLNLQSRGLPAVRMQKQLIRSGSQSLLYCAVIADSLPQAVEWEQRINQLPSVARVISLVKYLTEDQERKLALIREIKQELGGHSLACAGRPAGKSRQPEPDALFAERLSRSGHQHAGEQSSAGGPTAFAPQFCDPVAAIDGRRPAINGRQTHRFPASVVWQSARNHLPHWTTGRPSAAATGGRARFPA